jgi:DNA-binding protein H-NS
MARRSLKPHLNQIRTWVRQGRTDAWIAHQLEVTVQQIDAFKRENDLAPADENGADAVAADFDDEIDLRAEDDALIAAELEEAEARRAEEEAARAAAEEEAARVAAEKAAAEGDDEDAEGDDEDAPKRRRGRRGGRGRARRAPSPSTFEGTFDHGEEGYGLWLDPAVSDSPIYAEHWAGHRPVEVTVEEDQIVIRRVGGDDD